MRTLAAGLLFAMSAMVAMGQANAAVDQLAPVAWLAGGTWKAEVPSPNGGASTKIEQKMERMLGGKALRFETTFNGVEQYQGFFAYDAVKKQIVFAYPSAAGDVTNGVATEGPAGGVVMDFTISNADGTAAKYQVRIKKAGADDYTWSLFASSGATWTPMFEVKYHREN
jgi:hypothetical protein